MIPPFSHPFSQILLERVQIALLELLAQRGFGLGGSGRAPGRRCGAAPRRSPPPTAPSVLEPGAILLEQNPFLRPLPDVIRCGNG